MTWHTDSINFGQNYAILNLDWLAVLINIVEETPQGKKLVRNWTRWNNLIHQQQHRPLTIFTTLAFHKGQPELKNQTPFSRFIAPFGKFEEGSQESRIDPRFTVDEKDIVIQKTRWCATTGNNLEQILATQGIDTIIISGLSLSCAVMSTIYRLADLDYEIFVIRDNVMQVPMDQNTEFSRVFLDKALPAMSLRVITLDQAIQALESTLS